MTTAIFKFSQVMQQRQRLTQCDKQTARTFNNKQQTRGGPAVTAEVEPRERTSFYKGEKKVRIGHSDANKE
jgi:hypothetical protein